MNDAARTAAALSPAARKALLAIHANPGADRWGRRPLSALGLVAYNPGRNGCRGYYCTRAGALVAAEVAVMATLPPL